MELNTLIATYPRLYHMAEAGTWPSIKADGLLSTSAVLDKFEFAGAAREAIESAHRPEKITLTKGDKAIVLRDQIPMPEERLLEALVDGTSPQEWYRLINGKVFMWAQQERLLRLLNARYYRKLEHDVLTIDSATLLTNYENRVWLCPMNSGNTLPMPHSRGKATFSRIGAYPIRPRTGGPAKPVVEVVVDYAIPDISSYVVEVRRMKGTTDLGALKL